MKQTKLDSKTHKRELATHERLTTGKPNIHHPYAKKRRNEKRKVMDKPLNQIRETLLSSIERNYAIKAINSW